MENLLCIVVLALFVCLMSETCALRYDYYTDDYSKQANPSDLAVKWFAPFRSGGGYCSEATAYLVGLQQQGVAIGIADVCGNVILSHRLTVFSTAMQCHMSTAAACLVPCSCSWLKDISVESVYQTEVL